MGLTGGQIERLADRQWLINKDARDVLLSTQGLCRGAGLVWTDSGYKSEGQGRPLG
jgi:hypothetical protein